jgi:hypothetical protein
MYRAGGDTSGIDTTSAYKSNLSKEVTGPTNTLEVNALRNKSNVTAGGDTSTADGDMSAPNTNQKPIPQGEGAISPTGGSESYVVPSSPHGTGMEVEVTTDWRKQSPIPPRAETATTNATGTGTSILVPKNRSSKMKELPLANFLPPKTRSMKSKGLPTVPELQPESLLGSPLTPLALTSTLG